MHGVSTTKTRGQPLQDSDTWADRHRDRQTDRQTDTETDRQTDRQTHRQTDTETDRRQTDRDRQTQRQTDTGHRTDRDRETHRQVCLNVQQQMFVTSNSPKLYLSDRLISYLSFPKLQFHQDRVCKRPSNSNALSVSRFDTCKTPVLYQLHCKCNSIIIAITCL